MRAGLPRARKDLIKIADLCNDFLRHCRAKGQRVARWSSGLWMTTPQPLIASFVIFKKGRDS